MYFTDSAQKIFEFVNKAMNGEDILMNAIVSNYLSQFDLRLPCHGLTVEVERKEIAKRGEYVHIYPSYHFMSISM